jgi:hypothetical protein
MHGRQRLSVGFRPWLGLWLGLWLASLARVALAHTGGLAVEPSFLSPPGPPVSRGEDGLYRASPYDVVTVDQTLEVSWTDGDEDPTGRLVFHYLDHAPPNAVGVAAVDAAAPLIPSADGIYVSCSCNADLGCADFGPRDCRNAFSFDTSAIPDGTYWVIAVNDDPPFRVYAVSDGPFRVAHAGARPAPAVIVLRPDAIGFVDRMTTTQWIAQGDPPLRFSLSYAAEGEIMASGASGLAGGVYKPLSDDASDVELVPRADGTYVFDWDVGDLSEGLYHLRVAVRDGQGRTSYSDSRAGLFVLHRGGADLGGKMDDPGCSCEVGGHGRQGGAIAALIVIGCLLAMRACRPSWRRRLGLWLALALGLAQMACVERALQLVDALDLGVPVDLGVRDVGVVDLATGRDFAVDCTPLDEAHCQANAACVPDYCDQCTCGPPPFVGCRRAGEPPTECLPLDCAPMACCRTSLDCPMSLPFCLSPGDQLPRCGICTLPDPACTKDADCKPLGAHMICGQDIVNCICGPSCVPGCVSDGDCGEGQSCSATHHCVATRCILGCPVDFSCDSHGDCQRKTCMSDAQCAGYCVNGACHASRGTCAPPPPP